MTWGVPRGYDQAGCQEQMQGWTPRGEKQRAMALSEEGALGQSPAEVQSGFADGVTPCLFKLFTVTTWTVAKIMHVVKE